MIPAIAMSAFVALLPPGVFPPRIDWSTGICNGLTQPWLWKQNSVTAVVHLCRYYEHMVLHNVFRLDKRTSTLLETQQIAQAASEFRNSCMVHALIMKAGLYFTPPQAPQGMVFVTGELHPVYPIAQSLASIGESTFLPILNECLRLANDPTQEAQFGSLIVALSECKFVAKALDETQKRLFAKPNNRHNVRACKKVIHYLARNDYKEEIRDFTLSFPPPWWDKFKE